MIVAELPFSTSYKKSGILIRNTEDGDGVLYMKAAYKVLSEHIDIASDYEIQVQHRDLLMQGMQTITLAYRELTAHEINDF